MNAGEALEWVLRRIGDPDGDRVGPAEVMSLIDQGAFAFNRETHILRKSTTLSADATQSPAYAYWTKPTDLFVVDALEYQGEELFHRTEAQLRREYDDWRATSGTPEYYVMRPDHILLVPYPTDSSITVYLDYIRNPAATGANGEVDLPEAYQLAPVNWAVAEWLVQNDDHRDPGKAAYFRAAYAELVAQAQGQAMRRMSAGPRRVGRRTP